MWLTHKRQLTLLYVRITLTVLSFLVGAGFCFGPVAWHNSDTWYFVQLLSIPWWLYGVLFLCASVCLLFKKTRPIGYCIGAVIFTFFALATWLAVIGSVHGSWGFLHVPHAVTLPVGKVANLFTASNFSTIAIFYWAGLRWSIYDQVDLNGEDTG